MPRLPSATHLYLVAKAAAAASPTAMSSTASLGPLCAPCFARPFFDSKGTTLLVVGKRPHPAPHLDVVARCSSTDPATSTSWDNYAQKILASRLSSRVFRGFPSSDECASVYEQDHCTVLPAVRSAPFGSHSRRFGATRDGGNEDLRSGTLSDEEQGASPTQDEATSVDAQHVALGENASSVAADTTRDTGESRLDQAFSGEVENVTEEAPSTDRARGERRRRAPTDIPGRPLREWMDLLTVPGIGPRNMQKLVANGIAKLDELKQLYRDKYRSDGTEKMVEFLRSSVGVQKHHATSISVYIKNSVDAEEDGPPESGSKSKKRLTFCVEGNISVGKTTFLHRIANETVELRDLVEVVPEPIGKWQDVGPDHFNILDAFYGDPERYAYTFQNYVFVTRMMQERESAKGDKRLRLMERSVFSDRMVFVRAVHEAKWMSDAEISIYDSWFDPVVSAMPGLVPDAFIYLRATPDTCLRRLQSRRREEETNVTLDYLRGLHEKHEQWLFPAERGGSSVLSVSEWPSGHGGHLSSRLQDRVLYLQGENVHSSIQKVPALVLDCEPSIDFSRDVEAKAEYARQVAEFFQYVQGMKENQPLGSDSGSLILPGAGLVGPDGNLLRPNSLDGMQLRRHMSKLCV